MDFDKFTSYLHMQASKILINFEGTAHKIHQQGLQDTSYCKFYLDQKESDTTNTSCCTNENLATVRESLIERFIYNINIIDGNQDPMQMLAQHMLDEPSKPPPHSFKFSTCISQHLYLALWHGILPQAFFQNLSTMIEFMYTGLHQKSSCSL